MKSKDNGKENAGEVPERGRERKERRTERKEE